MMMIIIMMIIIIIITIIIIKAGRGARVTTHLQLEPRLKASAAKPYPAYIPSCRGRRKLYLS